MNSWVNWYEMLNKRIDFMIEVQAIPEEKANEVREILHKALIPVFSPDNPRLNMYNNLDIGGDADDLKMLLELTQSFDRVRSMWFMDRSLDDTTTINLPLTLAEIHVLSNATEQYADDIILTMARRVLNQREKAKEEKAQKELNENERGD